MANEKRLIDANALEKKMFYVEETNGGHGWVVALEDLSETPTVDAVEVVHGQWRKTYTCHGERAWGYECDQCKADNPRASHYCPNCGAKMDGGMKD